MRRARPGPVTRRATGPGRGGSVNELSDSITRLLAANLATAGWGTAPAVVDIRVHGGIPKVGDDTVLPAGMRIMTPGQLARVTAAAAEVAAAAVTGRGGKTCLYGIGLRHEPPAIGNKRRHRLLTAVTADGTGYTLVQPYGRPRSAWKITVTAPGASRDPEVSGALHSLLKTLSAPEPAGLEAGPGA